VSAAAPPSLRLATARIRTNARGETASTHLASAHTRASLLVEVRSLEDARALRRAGLATKVARNDQVDVVVARLLGSLADGLGGTGIERLLGKEVRDVVEMARREGVGRKEEEEVYWKGVYGEI
jgi:hypothetical protein